MKTCNLHRLLGELPLVVCSAGLDSRVKQLLESERMIPEEAVQASRWNPCFPRLAMAGVLIMVVCFCVLFTKPYQKPKTVMQVIILNSQESQYFDHTQTPVKYFSKQRSGINPLSLAGSSMASESGDR
ncbi:hypothetical protein JXA80_06665 [bacterium]|nr:hypothetical protein [candidate division CSSED10-310 bacterium]